MAGEHSAETIERLLVLRALLDRANQAAADTTLVGTQVAVVLLDGACELAIQLGLDATGVQPTKDFFANADSLHAKLDSAQPPDGWSGVVQLHKARNGAQHHGVQPAARQLGRWVGDAERYIRRLTSDVFSTDIRSVRLSTIIQNDAIRTQLEEAENSHAIGDCREALERAAAAFECALGQWAEAHDPPPEPPVYDALRRMSPEAGVVDFTGHTSALHRLTLILPFASDVSEFLWLESRLERSGSVVEVTADDANRALTASFNWIARWEAFNATYERVTLAEAFDRANETLRPPRTSRASITCSQPPRR